jgi:hypothetical protein
MFGNLQRKVFPKGMFACFLVSGCMSSPEWVSPEDRAPWKCAKAIEIHGRTLWASDATEYPVRITCHSGSGEDSGENVYLNADARDDFADVRFWDETGQALPYWMEHHTWGRSALFWVRVPRIPREGAFSLILGYGNSKARTTSNGQTTFMFFDDFLGTYEGRGKRDRLVSGRAPKGWEMSYLEADWIVKDGAIRFRGNGHLTTVERLWPDPTEECYALRCKAQWPTPLFAERDLTGQSFGGTSWNKTDGAAWMDVFIVCKRKWAPGKFTAWFGEIGGPATEEEARKYESYSGDHGYEWQAFETSDPREPHIFEIERKADETILRVEDTREERRSTLVIKDRMHLMIHGCGMGFPDTPYLTIDWMALRKQVYPPPAYGTWRTVGLGQFMSPSFRSARHRR